MGPRRVAELDRSARRRAVAGALTRAALNTVVVVAVYYLAPGRGGVPAGALARFAAGLVLLVLLLAWQVRGIVRADLPELRMVEAVATALPLFLVVCALTYLNLSHADRGAFSEPLTHSSALYFVVVVFGTVGFGDITPRSDTARLLVAVQVLLDLAMLGVILRLLFQAVQRSLRTAGGAEPAGVSGPGGEAVVARPVTEAVGEGVTARAAVGAPPAPAAGERTARSPTVDDPPVE